MIEMARLDGVPPNMSVNSTTPLPSSALATLSRIWRPPLLHVVVRPDADGRDVDLRADDVLQSGDQLLAKTTVGDDDKSDHD